MLRHNSISSKQAWINTIVISAIFAVAVIIALIIRF